MRDSTEDEESGHTNWNRRRLSAGWSAAIGAGVLVSSGALSVAQESSYGWRSTGHSLVVWLCIATIAANLGTFRQALVNTPAALAVAVLTYYIVLAVSGRTVNQAYLVLVVFWVVAALVGGLFLAFACHMALDQNDRASVWIARGTVSGMILGASLNSALGEQMPLTAHAWESFHYAWRDTEPYLVFGFVAATIYVGYVIWRCKARPTLRVVFLPLGLVAGWIVVTAPGLLVDVARAL